LHWDWHPANKQADGYTTCNRSSVQMPDGGLCKSISHPSAKRIRRWAAVTDLVMQLTAQLRRIRQMFFQPVNGHGLKIAIKKRGTQYNNVEITELLNFSQLIDERLSVAYT